LIAFFTHFAMNVWSRIPYLYNTWKTKTSQFVRLDRIHEKFGFSNSLCIFFKNFITRLHKFKIKYFFLSRILIHQKNRSIFLFFPPSVYTYSKLSVVDFSKKFYVIINVVCIVCCISLDFSVISGFGVLGIFFLFWLLSFYLYHKFIYYRAHVFMLFFLIRETNKHIFFFKYSISIALRSGPGFLHSPLITRSRN